MRLTYQDYPKLNAALSLNKLPNLSLNRALSPFGLPLPNSETVQLLSSEGLRSCTLLSGL